MRPPLEAIARWMHLQECATVEQGLFRGLTLIGGLLSILVIIPTNAIQGLPAFVNVSILAFGLLCLVFYRATFHGYYGTIPVFFLHMANLDLIWFGNAGSQGSIGLFFFTAALYLVIFFKGRDRWLALGFYVIDGSALLVAERLYPGLVHPFSGPDARYLDLATGFVLASVVCVLILWVVLDGFHREHDRLQAALEAQRESEARFKALVMNSPIPTCVATLGGRVDYLNHAFEQVLGYTREDVPHLDVWWGKAYPDTEYRQEVRLRWQAACAAVLATGLATPPEEFVLTCKNGRTAQMELQATVVGDRWLVMFTDMSERRRGEQALRQSQKLESMGVLAGGIAHDFNNLLSSMLGNLNLAQLKLTPGAASGPYLDNLEGTIGKAAELTRQMLAYSGKGQFLVVPMDLNQHVAEITHLLAVSISKKVRLQFEFAEGLPPIEADSAQFQQVVMNLVTNASEAMGETGGVITIATGLRDITTEEVDVRFPGQGLEPGSYVTLRVADSGCGMAPETLARIFDPFFSTKGSGRGLGLSAMLGILRGHHAGIEIHSVPGEGSEFQIHFRASVGEIPDSSPAEAGTHEDRFQGKVLLVDDEADLRFSFGSLLQHLGFQVVAARDGCEALERFQPGEYAVVFMDLTMPRMDGKEAFLQMKARDPEVKVVLTSGYSEQESIETLAGLRPVGFIQKPFNLQALTRVLELALR